MKLTKKQTKVAEMVCEGKELIEIAEEMGITTHGVKKHLDILFRKFGARTRPNLVWLYLRSKNESNFYIMFR